MWINIKTLDIRVVEYDWVGYFSIWESIIAVAKADKDKREK